MKNFSKIGDNSILGPCPGLVSVPMVKKRRLELEKPTLQDPTGDVDRILSALSEVLSAEGRSAATIRAPLGFMREASGALRQEGFRMAVAVADHGDVSALVGIVGAHSSDACLGLAIDIGTTTISSYLVDMTTGQILGSMAAENPQTRHGEDILTRIHFCQNPGGLTSLQRMVTECINGSAEALCANCGFNQREIYAVSVAGNPTMIHLFLRLDPFQLCREPYVPVFNRPMELEAWETGIDIHPHGPVYVFPNLGSYFGGDVVAGILASGMHKSKGLSMLLDVGTNAEVVLGNCDWLVVCAGAAGPALEAGGAKAGMRAVEGAIERIRIDRTTLLPGIRVIGGAPAQGICGSGLISAIAELYRSGIIDPKGRIKEVSPGERITEANGVKGYVVVSAAYGEGPKDIILDELDIGNLIRAKAAMYTALTLVTERLGVTFGELDHFFVAGSFGEHIDPADAITIGMLPDIPLERFKALGNSAGLGACLMLASCGLREEIESIRAKTAYIQLTTDNEFMSRLNAAIFIPHTDRGLFPSVP